MYEDMAAVVGDDAALIICAKWGGQCLYASRDGLWAKLIEERLGKAVSDTMMAHFRNARIEVPMLKDRNRAFRDREIKQWKLNGHLMNDIAAHFNMTARNVRRICAE